MEIKFRVLYYGEMLFTDRGEFVIYDNTPRFNEYGDMIGMGKEAEETLEQYIGLSDINNIEIYKGDKVKCKDIYKGISFIGIVDFQDASFIIDSGLIQHYRWSDYEVEIIGHIRRSNGE